MKNLFFIFILFMVVACSNNKSVYWCGDHPCINKKEKEAYFKKTMIVEIKDLKNKNYKSSTDYERIMQQAQSDEKKRIKGKKDLAKQAKLEEKRRIREKKDLTKQAMLEEKRRIREEKDLAKQAKLEKKRRIREEKDLAKQIKLEDKKRIKEEKELSRSKIVKNETKHLKKNVESTTGIANTKTELSKFSEIFEKITKRNTSRPFPDIDDIPN